MNEKRVSTALAAVVLLVLMILTTSPSLEAEPETLPDGYRVETISIPDHISLEVGGMAFASNGDLYLTTRYGEVWIYRDESWIKFADGLQHALGVVLEDGGDTLYVAQKPELTKLVDTDDDDRAEVYRTICDDWGYSGNYHEFAFGPVRDQQGNFYVTLNLGHGTPGKVRGSTMSRGAPDRGSAVKITPDGEMQTYARGLRSPAALAMSPKDELFVIDSQGDWVATSALYHIQEGEFYGHPSSLADDPRFEGKNLDEVPVSTFNELRNYPNLWIPYSIANSPGSPVFDTQEVQFGPFDRQLFVGDQTNSNVMRMDLEKVKGTYQGVVFNFIDHLQCGIVRSAFGPDGRSLWVGQTERGWSSQGSAPYGLQRIVYDGNTIPYEIKTIRLRKKGFVAQFTKPVDKQEAANPENYDIEHWDYKYHSGYGSPPQDNQSVNVESVNVSNDGRKVFLQLPELEAKRVYQIRVDVPSADGDPLTNETGFYTVKRKR